MADRATIEAEIKKLVDAGTLLLRRELIAQLAGDERQELIDAVAKDRQKEELLKAPYFVREYQRWYSSALRVVEQVLPDRYAEFRDLYKDDRRKELSVSTYGIADYVAGIRPSLLTERDALSKAMRAFERQAAIVSTAEDRLSSVLADIGRTLHSQILDDELAAAKNLLAASHLRSAGVVAGVVLEGHLKKLIVHHKVSFRRTPMLGALNEALKEAQVYDIPQWRQIQHLADIRNLCGHKGNRDPERAEVEHLIREVEKIVKNVF